MVDGILFSKSGSATCIVEDFKTSVLVFMCKTETEKLSKIKFFEKSFMITLTQLEKLVTYL